MIGGCHLLHLGAQGFVDLGGVLSRRNHACNRARTLNFYAFEGIAHFASDGEIRLLQEVVDHALEAHRTSVVGMVDTCDTVGL